MDMQVLTIADFSGGMTDNYVDCPQSAFRKAENFIRTPNGKLAPRPGSMRDDQNATTTGGRIAALIPFDQDQGNQFLLKVSVNGVYYAANGVMNQIRDAVTSSQAFPYTTANSVFSFGKWNKFVYITPNNLTAHPVKIYRDNSGTMQVMTAGLPPVNWSTVPAFTPSVTGTTYSYVYAIFFSYTYIREDGLTFEVDGPTRQYTVTTGSPVGGGATVTLSNITAPSSTNLPNEHYPATITTRVFRSINNGQTLYEITSQLAALVDNYPDTGGGVGNLTSQVPIYTSGGVYDHDQPPISKFVHSTDKATYYAYIFENGGVLSNSIRQSLPGIMEAVPAAFSVNIDDEIVGLSSVRSIPIVFGRHSVYRLDGVLDSLGNGNFTATKIANAIGGVNNLSVVQTIDTLYFAGSDGFYSTNGFQVTKLSNQINDTYLQYIQTQQQRDFIYGAYEANKKRVWWSVRDPAQSDNAFGFILDTLVPPQPDGSGYFTTFSGRLLGTDYSQTTPIWFATALVYYNNTIYRADSTGHTFRHAYDLLSDEVNGTGGVQQQPIQYDYQSGSLSFENPAIRKWVPTFSLMAEPIANLSVLPQSQSDVCGSFTALKEIYKRPLPAWGDLSWGNAALWSGTAGRMITQKRNFVTGDLRCFYRQLRLSNEFANVTSSDLQTLAIVSALGGGSRTVTMQGSQVFPALSAYNYYFSVETSPGVFSSLYQITAVSGTTMTISDAGGTCPSGSNLRWVIQGFIVGDVLKISALNFYYLPLTQSQKPYTGASGGNDQVAV